MHQEDAKSSRDKKENGQRDSWKSTNCDLASFFSVFIDNAKKNCRGGASNKDKEMSEMS